MSSERTEITTDPGRMSESADDDDPFDAPPPSIRANNAGAMEVFFAWEKLRLVYNGVLLVVTLSICGWAVMDVIVDAVLAALCANLMYCAGPVGECYLTWAGAPRVPARWVLFVLGLVLSMLIVVAIAVAEGLARLPMG